VLQRRFPQVEWLPYEPAARAEAVRRCDLWLGLGDTPFQSDCGPWMLEHLEAERETCRRLRKPMFFLGVGVGDREALGDARASAVLAAAEHVWVRDRQSASLLAAAGAGAKVALGADLAHLELRRLVPAGASSRRMGWLVHFERTEMFSPATVVRLMDDLPQWEHAWLVQEVRPLPGSERVNFEQLPERLRHGVALCLADHDAPDVAAVARHWPECGLVLSSRYHGALHAAWKGSRLVVLERNDKLRGVVDTLACASAPALTDPRVVAAAIEGSRAVPRERLLEQAELAERCCREFFEALRVAA